MLFFTDITTTASHFCLLNIKHYDDPRKSEKTLVFIDPGVMELRTNPEYRQVDRLHALIPHLQPNEYISIDYPCDMNPEYTNHFIRQTRANNLAYADRYQYIATVQFRFQDFRSFEWEYNYLIKEIDFHWKILGIGNLCRIMRPNLFTDQLFGFLRDHQEAHWWMHFYGLSLSLIRKYMPWFTYPTITVDNTKWTRAVTDTFKHAHGVACRKANRDAYFLEYMHTLQSIPLEVQY